MNRPSLQEAPAAGPPLEEYLRRPLNPVRLAAIERFARGSIIDVGCGNGRYVAELKEKYRIFGTDITVFPTWRAHSGLFTISDARNLPFDDRSFDTVLAFEVLEHLVQPADVLNEWLRVCRSRLILTVPNCRISRGMRRSNLSYYHFTDRTHVNFFDVPKLREMLQGVGAKVLQVQEVNRVSPFPMVAELFGLSPMAGQWLWRLLRPVARRIHFMTLLAVAEPSR
jgi:SAM-dependent methyltransferase